MVSLFKKNSDITIMQAYAAAKFADACLRGLKGEAGIIECSYVASQVIGLFSLSSLSLSRGCSADMPFDLSKGH